MPRPLRWATSCTTLLAMERLTRRARPQSDRIRPARRVPSSVGCGRGSSGPAALRSGQDQPTERQSDLDEISGPRADLHSYRGGDGGEVLQDLLTLSTLFGSSVGAARRSGAAGGSSAVGAASAAADMARLGGGQRCLQQTWPSARAGAPPPSTVTNFGC